MPYNGKGARFLLFNRNIKAWFITKSISATTELNWSEWSENQVTGLRGEKRGGRLMEIDEQVVTVHKQAGHSLDEGVTCVWNCSFL